MKKRLISAAIATTVSAMLAMAAESAPITGTMISSAPASSIYNTGANVFDGNNATYFNATTKSFAWVGLELAEKHVVTRVGFVPRASSTGPSKMHLGVFEGANKADFSDALPIAMVKTRPASGTMTYIDVTCSRGFKYVRYVGPSGSNCNVAEITFEGYASDGDDTNLWQVTNLPMVVVNTPGMEWFHDDNKEYAMEGSQVYVITGGSIDVGATAQIRGRGNASWSFPKKPFRIKFDKKQKVLGGPAKAKKWTMINNYGDKTLMRNMLAFEISRRVGMPYTPSCHAVDLIFNGEYQGTYQLCDQIEVNSNRVDITEMEPTDTEGDALTGGYLIEIDAYANQEPDGEWFYSQGGHSIPVTIKSPDPGVTAQFDFIRSRFTSLERAVYSGSYGSESAGYRRWLDEDSFLKHFIVGELSGNTDTYWSVYMSLDRGAQRFVTGPVWDFDLAFENDKRTYPINSKSDYICLANGSFANGMKEFVNRIVHGSQGSKGRLSELWSYARAHQGINADELDAVITEYADMLQESQALNFVRWPIMNTYVHQNPRIWGSYDAEVQNVRNYLRNRLTKLDTLIGLVDVSGVSEICTSTATASAADGCIVIEGYGAYTVANLQGIVIASGTGSATIAAAPGLYIVHIGNTTSKVIVK